jgi:prepilin-type N-terminal cleavage/methylation domain-containing protein/prepilin-type processing-associated H-X9-DG protein
MDLLTKSVISQNTRLHQTIVESAEKQSMQLSCHFPDDSQCPLFGLTKSSPPQKMGFTLIELLVVIAIIGILAALSFGAYNSVFNKTRTLQCMNNLMIHGRAITSYQSDHNQTFPLANAPTNNWVFLTLPYEEVALVGIKDPRASKSPYLCPEVIRSLPNAGGACTYGMNSQLSELSASRVQHPSRTALLADGRFQQSVNTWILHITPSLSPRPVHKGRAHVLFADFHVALVNSNSIPASSTDPFWNPQY